MMPGGGMGGMPGGAPGGRIRRPHPHHHRAGKVKITQKGSIRLLDGAFGLLINPVQLCYLQSRKKQKQLARSLPSLR